MPSKNKPKRLDRARSWRVARRKREKRAAILWTGRGRKKRPKNKAAIISRDPLRKSQMPVKVVAVKKVIRKVAKKSIKKVVE
ncbi:MAG: hypothetical protein NUV97_03575 [archaeon]|nr:hypothetical protein [archaeon]MCR4323902.1 hypothetical protein [Nanoarchaeota archaeon]